MRYLRMNPHVPRGERGTLDDHARALENVRGRRARLVDTLHALAREAGLTLWMTHHFLERFDIRTANPAEALTAFEVAARRLLADVGRALDGRKGRVLVGDFTFVADLTTPGRVVFVTYWSHTSGGRRGDRPEDPLLLTLA